MHLFFHVLGIKAITKRGFYRLFTHGQVALGPVYIEKRLPTPASVYVRKKVDLLAKPNQIVLPGIFFHLSVASPQQYSRLAECFL